MNKNLERFLKYVKIDTQSDENSLTNPSTSKQLNLANLLFNELKELLHITDNSFDESIMTFEIREGVYEKSNRCYYEEGIAPTLTCMCGDEKIIVVEEKHE